MRFTGIFVIIVALFVTVLISSNITAVKTIEILTLPFEFLGSSSLVLPAAIIIFPISLHRRRHSDRGLRLSDRQGSDLAGLRG